MRGILSNRILVLNSGGDLVGEYLLSVSCVLSWTLPNRVPFLMLHSSELIVESGALEIASKRASEEVVRTLGGHGLLILAGLGGSGVSRLLEVIILISFGGMAGSVSLLAIQVGLVKIEALGCRLVFGGESVKLDL